MSFEKVEVEKKLRAEAESFRKALDVQPKDEPHWFQTFPSETSQRICRILGKYLRQLGYTNISICSGNISVDYSSVDPDTSYYEKPYTFHAWLEVDGTIVDISADEYYPGSKPVMVTADRTWHENHFCEKRKRDTVSLLSDLNSDEAALLKKVKETLISFC